jgi:hypothetical protein
VSHLQGSICLRRIICALHDYYSDDRGKEDEMGDDNGQRIWDNRRIRSDMSIGQHQPWKETVQEWLKVQFKTCYCDKSGNLSTVETNASKSRVM